MNRKTICYAVLSVLACIGATEPARAESFTCQWGYPVLNITHNTGSSAGKPGMVFVGTHDAGKKWAAFYELGGIWRGYQGGLYQPAVVYYDAMPQVVQLQVTTRRDSSNSDIGVDQPMSTSGFEGWQVYVGVGILTDEAQAKVDRRRALLDSVKEKRIAEGRWNKEYESDDRFKWSLVQKDMVDNSKFRFVTTVPFIDCTPAS